MLYALQLQPSLHLVSAYPAEKRKEIFLHGLRKNVFELPVQAKFDRYPTVSGYGHIISCQFESGKVVALFEGI